jgi:hypothetical protein
MTRSFQPVFERLRGILQSHEADFVVSTDDPGRYGLEAPVGPATVRAWGGKIKIARIPIAWVEVRKNYVSYHLMGIDRNAALLAGLSDALRKQLHGKNCFQFTALDDGLVRELEGVTAASLRGLKKAGFI